MQTRTLAFVGCLNREAPYFQGARGRGIAVFDFDEATGRLAPLAEQTGIDNPTYLIPHPSEPLLYATSEVFGWNEGLVTAYRVDAASGALRYINKQATLGSITAHGSLDHRHAHLLIANYSHGEVGETPGQAVAVLRLRGDGGLEAAHCSAAHEGSGPHPERQGAPHPHCALASPDDRFVLVSDLGTDSIVAYRYDAASGELGDGTACRLPPGSGPRHLAFHPDGTRLYVINELSSTIAVLAYDAATAGLRVLQIVSAVPDGFAGENHCADLHVSADGRFLYGSNRGHDSIVVHAIEGEGLRLVGHVPTGGSTPRSFALDPLGHFLLAANQNGDSVVVFRLDAASGMPQRIGDVAIGTPMCIRLARVAG